jgi:hypothetical protein
MWRRGWAKMLPAILLLSLAAGVRAEIAATKKISDVRGTRHNLSAAADGSETPSGGRVPVRAVKASSETQVCVFCHTPHEAELIQFGSGSTRLGAPLWNRKLSTAATYTSYSSSSIDAIVAQPGGSSKLCLSCHDGTMAIDKVNALNGVKSATIAMNLPSPVTMPSSAALTGFTRDLGVNLSNDHPISFAYDAALAAKDGELRTPDGVVVGNRRARVTPPKLPLENDQVECATCHDPHLRDQTTSNGNAKFLRMNRFQAAQPGGGAFVPADDIICLACHNKGGLSWAYSAHANKGVANQTYDATAAKKREFPSSLDTPANTNPTVWQVACLNCHDTHTVQGARRLLREGANTGLTADGVQNGLESSTAPFSKSAIENTCYQCHDGTTGVLSSKEKVPNIKGDFALTYRMPISSVDQGIVGTPASLEAHDIGTGGLAKGGADFVESQPNLGFALPGNRHAECTDCHNPHRVIKAQSGLVGTLTSDNAIDKAGTHKHEDATGYVHTNIISGVLRGSFGVEPVYPDAKFDSMPGSFDIKRGDPGSSVLNDVSQTFVTREYQICLKCHSNYGYDDDNVYPNSALGKRPTLGGLNRTGNSPSGHSNFTTYTNQAKEFQAPLSHQGPSTDGGCLNLGNLGGAAAAWTNCNHRSWHPVMAPTGRTTAGRGGLSATNWRLPFRNIGTQTMYCSDCHGSDTTRTGAGNETAMPVGNTNTIEDGNPWGPHGSNNPFLLKGLWNTSTGTSQQTTGLCFKCHSYAAYATRSDIRTGFYSTDKGDLHTFHADKIGKMRCNWCHTAVPHGWKNKALLVNLRDLGPEVGLPAGTAAPAGVYNNGPYYRNAYLRVSSFAASGRWSDSNCGGKNFMISTCDNPP